MNRLHPFEWGLIAAMIVAILFGAYVSFAEPLPPVAEMVMTPEIAAQGRQ